MMIRLLMTNLTAEQWVELSGAEKYHIGREEGEFVVLDSKCSRKHALLYADSNGDLFIRDLGSSNGTFVNQEKISEKKLSNNDVIKVGSTVLLLIEYQPENIEGDEKARVRYTPFNNDEPQVPKAAALEAKSQTKGRIAQPGSELLIGWPNNIRSLPKESLKNFVNHFDEQQRKKSKRLIELLESEKKKAS